MNKIYRLNQPSTPNLKLGGNHYERSQFRRPSSADYTGYNDADYESSRLGSLTRQEEEDLISLSENLDEELDQANWMQLQYPKPRESFSSRVNYSGRGPKGYKRSDERIREDVCDKLQKHSLIDASEIEVDVSDGCVYLKGYVSSRNIKRMAENAIQNISGVSDVQNLLKIKQYDF